MASATATPTPSVTPLVDEGLGNSSYVVDIGGGQAMVVDPARHPGGYLRTAERLGLDVRVAVETHLHADFVSGGRELATLGADLLAPAAGAHRFPVHGLDDGDRVDVGDFVLEAVATPGHTPEHLAYLLHSNGRPVALFSGGSLLVDSVARTDLISPDRTESLARDLWRSLQERILVLPDDVAVYPTHGAGSFCSAPARGERVTTIGRERAANPLLAAPDEDAFVDQLLAGLGTYPPYFLRLRDVNAAGPHRYGPGRPGLPRISAGDVARLNDGGAWVIDVRPAEAFAAAHIPGSISIALRPQFGTWLGWLVPAGAPLVFVFDDDQDRADAVLQARNVGYDDILGELDGGLAGWQASGRAVESTPTAQLADPPDAPILDVRQRNEFAAGHVPGARNVELGVVASADVPAAPLALMCGHGERAMTAASLLGRRGRRDVVVLFGGPQDWAWAHGAAVGATQM